MKKITSKILLYIYAIGLLAPVSPIITDVLAHTFWRAQHMATVHCVNGKYHVHYELYKANSTNSGKGNSTVKADETISIHLQPGNDCIPFTFTQESIIIDNGQRINDPFIKINSQPPELT
jgi:hypothetical protein